MRGELWRHKKRGTIYEVVATVASLQCSYSRDIEDRLAGKTFTVYRFVETGVCYARPTEEFMDGRFERVNDTAPSSAKSPANE